MGVPPVSKKRLTSRSGTQAEVAYAVISSTKVALRAGYLRARRAFDVDPRVIVDSPSSRQTARCLEQPAEHSEADVVRWNELLVVQELFDRHAGSLLNDARLLLQRSQRSLISHVEEDCWIDS